MSEFPKAKLEGHDAMLIGCRLLADRQTMGRVIPGEVGRFCAFCYRPILMTPVGQEQEKEAARLGIKSVAGCVSCVTDLAERLAGRGNPVDAHVTDHAAESMRSSPHARERWEKFRDAIKRKEED